MTGSVFLNAPRGGFPPGSDPLDEVRVTWVDWDGVSFVTREVELDGPSPFGGTPSGGPAAAFRYSFTVDGVKIPPGESRIHAVALGDGFLVTADVTVTGTGAPDRPVAGYERLVDFQPLGIEVTQGLRPALDTVTPGEVVTDDTVHVARRDTVVRLYGRSEFSGSSERGAPPASARRGPPVGLLPPGGAARVADPAPHPGRRRGARPPQRPVAGRPAPRGLHLVELRPPDGVDPRRATSRSWPRSTRTAHPSTSGRRTAPAAPATS